MKIYKFIIYSRKSRDAQDGHTQHTHGTAEFEIQNYLNSLDKRGIEYEIVERVEENISGYGYYDKRPLFSKIVDKCKKDKSLTLLASKCDRVARDAWSGAELLKTINLVIANMPDADDMTLQIHFTVAEGEVFKTSERHKATAAAKRKRCEELGIPFEWGASSKKYQEKLARGEIKHVAYGRKHKTEAHLIEIKDSFTKVITLMKKKELKNCKMTLANIAKCVNMFEIPSTSGKGWNSRSVDYAMDYYGIQRG